MESDIRAEKTENADLLDSSCESKKIRVLEAKAVEGFSRKMVNSIDSMPMTPDPKRENMEASAGIDTPLTWVLTLSNRVSTDSDRLGFCSTPKENIFNPFAPGSEELLFAPRKRPLEDTQFPLSRRRLNFGFGCGLDIEKNVEEDIDSEEDAVDESDFLESYCESLIHEIVSKQGGDGILSRNLMPEFGVDDGFKTPDSPLLNGISVACPGAPRAPSGKTKKVIAVGSGCARRLKFF